MRTNIKAEISKQILEVSTGKILYVNVLKEDGPIEYSLVADVTEITEPEIEFFMERLYDAIRLERDNIHDKTWLGELEPLLKGKGTFYTVNRIGFYLLRD